MIATLRRLCRLTPADLVGLFLAYLYLMRAGWRIFVVKEKLDRWLTRDVTSGVASPLAEPELRPLTRRAHWVNAAARRPYSWARCLQRSLALCIWLERKGFQPELKIGVSKEKETLQAHAWVEYRGQVINDRASVSRRFKIMNQFAPGMPWADEPVGPDSSRSQAWRS